MLIMPNINSIFIEDSDIVNTIDDIVPLYDCIAYLNDRPLTLDSKDSLIEIEGRKLFYIGNSNYIIKIIYYIFKEKYNMDPFDNMNFLSLVLDKNKVQYIKGDGIAFLDN